MGRRLGISLSLLLLGVAVWMFRGGGASAPEQSEIKPTGASSAEPGRERPLARDLNLPGKADRPAPRGQAGALPRSKLEAAPLPLRRVDPNQSAAAAADLKRAELEDLIHTATEDPDPTARAAAIADLSGRDELAAIVPAIQRAASDRDPDVKLAVVMALAQFGEAVPLDLLNQVVNDPDPEIRLEALDIVETLSEEDGLPDLMAPILRRAAGDRDEEVRERAGEIIERLEELRESSSD